MKFPLNISMVPETGFEPVTFALEGRCSIQLSYSGMVIFFHTSCVSHFTIFTQSYPEKVIKIPKELENTFSYCKIPVY